MYALFGKYTVFEGPFYSEGYLDKKIGVQISRGHDTFVDMDLLAVKEDGSWIGLELTTDPKASKDDQLDRYSSVRPEEIMHKVALHIIDDKELMLFDTAHIESRYPQITFSKDSILQIYNACVIQSDGLRAKTDAICDDGQTVQLKINFAWRKREGFVHLKKRSGRKTYVSPYGSLCGCTVLPTGE